MADLARIKRNVAKMVDMGAPEGDIDGYIAAEGVTVDDVRNYSEQPAELPNDIMTAASNASQQLNSEPPSGPSMHDRAQSFARGFIEGVPIAGPALSGFQKGAEVELARLISGKPREELQQAEDARSQFLEQKAGNERMAGNIAGAVVPLTGLGLSSQIAGRALGMTGGLGSQTLMGGLSGAAISAADTKARGGSNEDALLNSAVGGGLGGIAPLAFKGLGAGWNALTKSSAQRGAQMVAKAATEDELAAMALPGAMKANGPDTMLMDMGDNLQTLAGGLAANRGPAQKVLRDAIATRDKAAGSRVATDVAQNIGTPQELGALTEQIVAAQKAAADPLYAAVRPAQLQPTGNLRFVFQTPMGKDALRQAINIARNDGFDPSSGLTVGLVDYAKQALDDVANAATRAGKNNEARQARNLARILAKEADQQVPDYAKARDAFAGPAQVLEAIDQGRGAFARDMSPADMKRLMADMTVSEKDAFLQGAQTAVADLLGNSANDVAAVRTLLRKPYNEAKLRELIGSEATDDLLRGIDRELIFGKSGNVVAKNSETARRTLAAEMVNPQKKDVGSISTLGVILAGINKARGALGATLQPKVNRHAAELLSSKNLSPAQVQQINAAQRPPMPLPIAPASVPLLSKDGSPIPMIRIPYGDLAPR